MNRKRLWFCEQDKIRILGRKLAKRLVPEDVQKIYEKADGLEESFNSRKLKAWHMVQEAGAASDLRTLKMIDKLTAHYDMTSCLDDTADFMERSHRNDILEEEVVNDNLFIHRGRMPELVKWVDDHGYNLRKTPSKRIKVKVLNAKDEADLWKLLGLVYSAWDKYGKK